MRLNSKVPKTFSIFVSKGNMSGFVRYISTMDSNENITYIMTFTNKNSEASKYVNFDNVKRIASEMAVKNDFDEVRVIDDKTKKGYNVKKEKN